MKLRLYGLFSLIFIMLVGLSLTASGQTLANVAQATATSTPQFKNPKVYLIWRISHLFFSMCWMVIFL